MILRMHALQLASQLCLMADSIEDRRAIVRHLLELVEGYLAAAQEPTKPALRVVVPIREEEGQP